MEQDKLKGRKITLIGALDDMNREKLLAIADKCPVHRTLEGQARIKTELTPVATSGSI